jgi:hypothetical protein
MAAMLASCVAGRGSPGEEEGKGSETEERRRKEVRGRERERESSGRTGSNRHLKLGRLLLYH